LSIALMLAAGCAKRPATLPAAAAPAPTGSASGSIAKTATSPTPAAPAPRSDAEHTTARPSPSEFRAVSALDDIHFDFDRYDIRPEDARILDKNAAWLKDHTNERLMIEGHCDERGTNEYNLALGDRRAKATQSYLIAQGVTSSRISLISYGEERPLCTEHNEACWAKNRRAHFLVKAE
jgi:peptidoglycan-associated lipoprotein